MHEFNFSKKYPLKRVFFCALLRSSFKINKCQTRRKADMSASLELKHGPDDKFQGGKNGGWWKEAKQAREKKVFDLLAVWYDGFDQKQDAHAYVSEHLSEVEKILIGTENDLNILINKALYKCLNLG
ncbi:MAG: hypothetical protein CO042_03170 [Parcubacteria group bacterium CG_4_9_14_0_2_um_filter_41_8]|nr:MAG: hypothetical protein AUJ34_00680 [Parcubacteria group bacterium CG1_02_41_12]PIQ80306.1 MAG: hypothetical protein COV79_01170 [Parcubacteria group bacterium CG11_big_fil_rev_8_21_14_0_20_41_14]PIR57558.1 MAG: hypothetical protein COU72_00310 [Parcubacteria group bacterium CG10_big_fil_rev_8_21_14_0_10_41_35]PJC40548.1 MAG: hypothetical protein CO042_03170 [Parcubacteria group bacterium CG_4_9_14_0_2_um_filter_41_8]